MRRHHTLKSCWACCYYCQSTNLNSPVQINQKTHFIKSWILFYSLLFDFLISRPEVKLRLNLVINRQPSIQWRSFHTQPFLKYLRMHDITDNYLLSWTILITDDLAYLNFFLKVHNLYTKQYKGLRRSFQTNDNMFGCVSTPHTQVQPLDIKSKTPTDCLCSSSFSFFFWQNMNQL